MEEQGEPLKPDWKIGQPDRLSALVVWGIVVTGLAALYAHPALMIWHVWTDVDASIDSRLLGLRMVMFFPVVGGAALRWLVGFLSPWSTWTWDEETVRRVATTPCVRGRFHMGPGVRSLTPQRGALLFEDTGLAFITREFVTWRVVVVGLVLWTTGVSVMIGFLTAVCGVYLMARRRTERRIDYAAIRAVDATSLQAAVEFQSDAGIELLRFRPAYGDRPRLREQVERHCPGALQQQLLGAAPRHGDRPRVHPRTPRAAGIADLERSAHVLEDSRGIQDAARRD